MFLKLRLALFKDHVILPPPHCFKFLRISFRFPFNFCQKTEILHKTMSLLRKIPLCFADLKYWLGQQKFMKKDSFGGLRSVWIDNNSIKRSNFQILLHSIPRFLHIRLYHPIHYLFFRQRLTEVIFVLSNSSISAGKKV